MLIHLDVTLENKLVGHLKLTEQRLLEFQYSEHWMNQKESSIPLSVRLPIVDKTFKDEEVRPFFENLLPESIQRKIIAQEFQISEKNIFALLEAIGGECAGAVSLVQNFKSQKTSNDKTKSLSHEELIRIINELPTKPLMTSKNLRLSLAGVQEKLLIRFLNDKIYLPTSNYPSTHILKPNITHFNHSVINEYFCMTLASVLDLPIPELRLLRLNSPLYIIKRYDRLEEKGNITRIHQEDFCQATGCLSDQKYESEGGPSIKKCIGVIKKYSIQPIKDIQSFIRLVVFNYLVGNADAHGKNIAFLLTEKGPHLAPFYDILSTEMYPRLSKKFAMKIGGENRGDWIESRHWERFANEIEVKFMFVQSEMKQLITNYDTQKEKILDYIKQLEKEEQEFCFGVLKIFEKRKKKLHSIVMH